MQSRRPVFGAPGLYWTYDQYMLSDLWRNVREDYVENLVIDGRCENCRERPGEQLHHLWYPSEWGMETADSLAWVCRRCHAIAHETEAGATG